MSTDQQQEHKKKKKQSLMVKVEVETTTTSREAATSTTTATISPAVKNGDSSHTTNTTNTTSTASSNSNSSNSSIEIVEEEKSEASVWLECCSLQSAMKKALKSNHDPFRAEIESMQSQLRQHYLYLLQEHLQFSHDKDVLVNLWKFVFYKKIEFIRKQLRGHKHDHTLRTPLVHQLTHDIIPEAKQLYHAMLDAHLQRTHVVLVHDDAQTHTQTPPYFIDQLDAACSSQKTPRSVQMDDIRLSLQMAHKTLIYIGDLERYHETYATTTGTTSTGHTAAAVWYKLASQLMPVRGNPHNQLAVLGQTHGGEFSAVYRYVLSLLVAEPFMTAKENLGLLFKKNIGVVDKERHDEAKLVQLVRAVSSWAQLQTYVLYVLGVLYHASCRGTTRYHGLLRKLQPAVLEALRRLLVDVDVDAEAEDNAKKEEEDVLMRLCVMSIFVVHDTFNAKLHFVGYKQAIAWTLSLISAMMQWYTSSGSSGSGGSGGGDSSREWLLRPITLCCMWLQRHFEFAVPDIDQSPWLSMHIDQSDLQPNNALFLQFARLLNVLHERYQTMATDDSDEEQQEALLPEQLEFYGVQTLRFIGEDTQCRYRGHEHFVFIYHRRFGLQHGDTPQQPAQVSPKVSLKTTSKTAETKDVNCIRYHKLREFARYSARKIEGVLVFHDQSQAWIANNLQLTDDTPATPPPVLQPQVQPPQVQAQVYHRHQQVHPRPTTTTMAMSKTPSPPTKHNRSASPLPAFPMQQKSSDAYCSPMYHHTQHRPHYPPQPVPHQHAHYGQIQVQPPPQQQQQQLAGYRVPPARYANISKSAPASPRGLSSRPSSHGYHRNGQPAAVPAPHSHRPYMFNQHHAPPLMEDYPEDNHLPQQQPPPQLHPLHQLPAPPYQSYEYRHQHASSARAGHHHSTPTSPTHKNNHQQQQQHRQHQHQSPSRYQPVYNYTVTAGATAGVVDSTAFSFNSPYAAAATSTGYGGSGIVITTPSNHALQPVTQPTTPVFTAHRTPSNSFTHLHSFARSHPSSQRAAVPTHTPHNSGVFGLINDPGSPLLCEDIVTEIFEELRLAEQ